MRPLCVLLIALAAAPAVAQTIHNSDAPGIGAAFAVILFIIGMAMYLLPSIIASGREVASPGGIYAVNFLLGWTFIGWVAALVWACSAETKRAAQLREDYQRMMTAVMAQHQAAAPPAAPPAQPSAQTYTPGPMLSVGRAAGSLFHRK